MPFATGDTITATDMNNVLRGLYRDNTDHVVTGAAAETDMASMTLTANTLGATGSLHIVASGTITSATGTKRVRLFFGATAIVDLPAAAGTSDWWIDCWIYNTATNAQRIIAAYSDHTNATNFTKDYTTAAIDTASSQTIKCAGTPAGAADVITQKTFNIDIVQRT